MTMGNDRYAKLAASWHGHPKLLAVGLDGMGLHSWAQSYCMDWLTDGFVPAGALPNLPRQKQALKALLDAGLFERAPNGYRIHDWHDWQYSREELEQRRKRAMANARQARYMERQRNVSESVSEVRQMTLNGTVR